MSGSADRGRLFVIGGMPGVGTSSVGLALAETLGRAIFIDGATIGDMVVSGRVEHDEDEPSQDAVEQVLFRYAGGLVLADTYRAAGFDAVIAEAVGGEFLDDYLQIAAPETLHLVMLHPSTDAVRERDASRDLERDDQELEDSWTLIDTQTARLGLWLDTTHTNVPETVLEIIQRQHEAELETKQFAAE